MDEVHTSDPTLVCGISSNTDGSQDGQIHSLKPGQVAHSAADTIEKETARLNLATDVEADDPFADLDAGVHDEGEDNLKQEVAKLSVKEIDRALE